MKRTLLIVLLSLGTVFGFASGCASVARHVCHHRWHSAQRHPVEEHVAAVCVRAAERSRQEARADAETRMIEAAERTAIAAEQAARAAERTATHQATAAPSAGAIPGR